MTATLIKDTTPVTNDPWMALAPLPPRETVGGCADCGAPADAPCDIACTSAADLWLADLLEQEANDEPPCHSDRTSAARALCGCW